MLFSLTLVTAHPITAGFWECTIIALGDVYNDIVASARLENIPFVSCPPVFASAVASSVRVRVCTKHLVFVSLKGSVREIHFGFRV